MNFICSVCVCCFISLAVVSAAAQTPDDLALMKKVTAAAAAAPASRVTSTVTDLDSGAVVETAVIERTPPDMVHVVTTHNGQPDSEMISDGKRSLRRAGPNDPWKPLPMNLSEMMNASRKELSDDQMREQHGHLTPVGDDRVDGVAAKVYELTTDSGRSKIWIAADTSRLLKAERDYEGPAPSSPMKRDANGKIDFKAMQAQLKAATAQHHLHSVTAFVYDPSITITMPEN
jgi:hypothetical protein